MALRAVPVLLLSTFARGAGASQVKVTPIGKVTELLKGLQTKVEAEGKQEAAEYDKYACFCKEQSSDKLYVIEKSKKIISRLTSEITKLEADIAQLTNEISKSSLAITAMKKEIDKETEIRNKDHEEYLVKAKDLDEAIDMCGKAIEAMQESKGDLKDAKVNLAQVHNKLSASLSLQKMSQDLLGLVQKIGQEPAKYQFQGNDIIAILQKTMASMKSMKKDLDFDEMDLKAISDKKVLGLSNEKEFAEKERAQKEAIAESKTEELNDAKEANDDEKKDMNADENFLDVVTKECQDKAQLFDQRSETRAGELTAISKAIEALEDGVIPNEGANKKLVGFLQQGKQSKTAPSFVQIFRTLQQDGHNAVKRVEALLEQAAGRLDSTRLTNVMIRVKVSEDHFVKVRGLIKDLIEKLKADAESEAEQKSFCDKAMKEAITSRDMSKAKQEKARALLSTAEAKKESLEEEIADLNEAIAKNKKALLEATELRDEEKTDNEKTINEADQGMNAAQLALVTLQDFYSTAFLQTRSKYVPPDADREGKTFGDLAPDAFDSKYHGSQEESKGIIGILEVIVADFARTIKKVSAEETAAEEAFEKFKKENLDDTDTKEKTVKKKEEHLHKTKAFILEQEEAIKDATDILDAAEDKLDELKSGCVDAEEDFAERAAKRKAEVEALKEALAILEDWKA
jgi:hypothetical protein